MWYVIILRYLPCSDIFIVLVLCSVIGSNKTSPIPGSSHPLAESLLKHWFLSKDNYIYVMVDKKV